MEKGRFPNWCITKNARKDIDEQGRINFIGDYTNGGHPTFANSKIKYIIWTLEENSNLHYHFYVEFTEKVSMKWIKENFEDNTLRCDVRNGTQKQAIEYVKKIGEWADKFETKVYKEFPWFEIGERKQPGNRSDLDTMVDCIEEGFMAGDILRMFRGNALRHMGMIERSIKAMYKCTDMDKALNHLNREERRKEIERLYKNNEKCPEVDG